MNYRDNPISILAVADDAGGAHLLSHTLSKLKDKISFKFLLPTSRKSFARLDPEIRPFLHFVDPDKLSYEIKPIIGTDKIDVLFVGTSMGFSLEKRTMDLLAPKKIKSVALLDYWSNYAKRFFQEPDKNILTHLPDRLLVMDELAKQECIREGIPADTISIIGHPFYETLSFHGHKQQKDKETFCFVSQPLRKLYSNQLGYDEFTALQDLLEIMGELNLELPLTIVLHPADERNKYDELLKATNISTRIKNGFEEVMVENGNLCVVGISSTVLVEAYLLGFKVLVYQPNQLNSYVYPFEKFTKVLRNRTQLKASLTHRWEPDNDTDRYSKLGLPKNSVQKILREIQNVL